MPKKPNKPLSLEDRLNAINQWCYMRGINQQYTFFLGCDRSLIEHYHRIRAVLPKRAPVKDSDAVWMASMELTMEALNNRGKAA